MHGICRASRGAEAWSALGPLYSYYSCNLNIPEQYNREQDEFKASGKTGTWTTTIPHAPSATVRSARDRARWCAPVEAQRAQGSSNAAAVRPGVGHLTPKTGQTNELQGQTTRQNSNACENALCPSVSVSLSPKPCAEFSPLCPWRWRIRASTPPPPLFWLALHIAAATAMVVVSAFLSRFSSLCGRIGYFLFSSLSLPRLYYLRLGLASAVLSWDTRFARDT